MDWLLFFDQLRFLFDLDYRWVAFKSWIFFLTETAGPMGFLALTSSFIGTVVVT